MGDSTLYGAASDVESAAKRLARSTSDPDLQKLAKKLADLAYALQLTAQRLN